MDKQVLQAAGSANLVTWQQLGQLFSYTDLMFISMAVAVLCSSGKFLELLLLEWFVSKCVKKKKFILQCALVFHHESGDFSLFLFGLFFSGFTETFQPEHKINTFLSLADRHFHFWLLLSIRSKIIHSWPPVNANNDSEIIGAVFVLTN